MQQMIRYLSGQQEQIRHSYTEQHNVYHHIGENWAAFLHKHIYYFYPKKCKYSNMCTLTWVNVQNFQNTELHVLKLAVCLQNNISLISSINGQLKINQRSNYNLSNSGF